MIAVTVTVAMAVIVTAVMAVTTAAMEAAGRRGQLTKTSALEVTTGTGTDMATKGTPILILEMTHLIPAQVEYER